MTQVTFVLSICVLSMERNHLIANAPWLAGSALTVLLDFVVCTSPLSLLNDDNSPFVCLIGPWPVLLLSIRNVPVIGNINKTYISSVDQSFFINTADLITVSHIEYFAVCVHTHAQEYGQYQYKSLYTAVIQKNGTHKVQQHCGSMRG